MEKKRVDILLVEKGLAPTREKAQALIMSGSVIIDDIKIEKAGQKVSLESKIRIKGQAHDFVSRGAIKLQHALKCFNIDVKNKIAIDIGASTGGFTEVLLRAGIEKVLALDVGHNQLDWKIRSNPKVKVIEGYNARYLNKPDLLNWEFENFNFIVVDVSFISLILIFKGIAEVASLNTEIVTLIKPQFEVGKENIEKGGIVKNPLLRKESVDRVIIEVKHLGFELVQLEESPIKGTEGNVEYLAYWRMIK